MSLKEDRFDCAVDLFEAARERAKWKALFNWFMIGSSRDILLGGTACHSGDSLLCTGKSSAEGILSLSRSFAKN